MTLTDDELEFLLKCAKASGVGNTRLELLIKIEKELKERKRFREECQRDERRLAAIMRMAAED